jgi:RimJ/RimL family protein N-acetyltransferase
MRILFETKRLAFREMSLDDLEVIAEMLAHPEVMRYWPRCYTREEAADWIQRQQERYARDGVGYWLAVDKELNQPIGQAGLLSLQVDGAEELAIGYIIRRPFWRRGFATEAAVGSASYGFNQLGRDRIVTLIRPENTPSIGVARKLGMIAERNVHHADFEHIVFVVPRPKVDEQAHECAR